MRCLPRLKPLIPRFIKPTLAALAALFLIMYVPTGATAQESGSTESLTKSQPNIILIVADDLDYGDISLHGGTKTPTPNIDSIAKNGVQFTQAYVTCPVCGPSRVALLTGRYQDRIGFVSNHGPQIPDNFGLPSSEVLIPEMLKQAGYKTGMIGKWHLGFKPDMVPNAQGFDYFFGHLHGAHHYTPGVENPGPILRNTEPVKTTKWLTTAFGEEAARYISENAEGPYFLYVPFNAVHSPLQASPELLQKFAHIPNERNRTMAAMIYEMDEAVGQILSAVKSTGAEENTLVVFFNDNGGVKGPPGANAPFRGGKATLYEGGIRVPLLMQWPAQLQAGTTYQHPVIAMDLAPTFVAAANATTTAPMEGVNLLPFARGERQGRPHESLFWRFVDVVVHKAVRKEDHKIVKPEPGKPWELYNLAADPGEQNDLASSMPAKVSELAGEWTSWNKDNSEPLFLDSRIVRQRRAGAADGSTTATKGSRKRQRNRAGVED